MTFTFAEKGDTCLFLHFVSEHVYLSVKYDSSVTKHNHNVYMAPNAWTMSFHIMFFSFMFYKS